MEVVSKWNVADMPIRILSIKKAADMFSTGHKLPSIDQPWNLGCKGVANFGSSERGIACVLMNSFWTALVQFLSAKEIP